jgi:hypothetical protein
LRNSTHCSFFTFTLQYETDNKLVVLNLWQSRQSLDTHST